MVAAVISTRWLNPELQRKRRPKPDLRPTQAPLRYHRGRLQQQHVVTRYKPNGRQDSQVTEWRDVEEA
jgi:hypothetical protein